MVIIMRTMVALSAFAAIFTATGGGPGTATEILNLYAYRTSFTELSIGYGSALAMVLLIVTLVDLRHAVPRCGGRNERTGASALHRAARDRRLVVPARRGRSRSSGRC